MVSVGIAEAAFRACCEYAKVRVQFGKPIASFEMVQAMIADMAMKVEGARLLVHRACWMKDQGMDFTQTAAIANPFTTIESAVMLVFMSSSTTDSPVKWKLSG